MNGDPNPWTLVGQAQSRASLRDAELVLRAKSIPFVIEHRDGLHVLGVPRELADVARHELGQFAREEREHVSEPVVPITPAAFWWQGLVLFVGLLITFHVFATAGALGLPWYEVGSADAGRIAAGELWRTVTALTLHTGVPHLGSNLMYGCLLGGLVAYARGGGVAFAAILLSGALGNVINAFAQDATHLSVGASTAVFGAAGLLCGSEWRRRTLLRAKPVRRFGPLFLGLVLFAWLGIGENPTVERIDVFAHAFGLGSGLVLGAVLASTPEGWRDDRRLQLSLGLGTFGVVAAAWLLAFQFST